jgi:hypothetical protein
MKGGPGLVYDDGILEGVLKPLKEGKTEFVPIADAGAVGHQEFCDSME